MWMKVHSEREREALYIGCVYMLSDSTSIFVVNSCYERLKEDILSFTKKENNCFVGSFQCYGC